MTNVLSIGELLDGIEGADEHVLHITEGDWKLTHPLACRIAGLTRCKVLVPTLMFEGTFVLQGDSWVEVTSY